MINQIQDDTGAACRSRTTAPSTSVPPTASRPRPPRAAVNAIANPTMPEVGERYLGTVVKTTNFGAFVSLLPGKDGLLHISKLRALAGGKRVENVDDVVSVGQKIQVQIAEIDDRGKLSLVPVVEDAARAGGRAPTTDGRRRGRGRRVTHVVPVTTGRQPAAGRSSASTSPRGRPGRCSDEDGGVVRRTVLPSGLRVITEQRARRAVGHDRGVGRASARATSRRRCTAARTSSSTCSSRAPRSAPRSTSRSRSTRSAASSTPSPPRSTPASTPGCSTRTCRWPSTSSAT